TVHPLQAPARSVALPGPRSSLRLPPPAKRRGSSAREIQPAPPARHPLHPPVHRDHPAGLSGPVPTGVDTPSPGPGARASAPREAGREDPPHHRAARARPLPAPPAIAAAGPPRAPPRRGPRRAAGHGPPRGRAAGLAEPAGPFWTAP